MNNHLSTAWNAFLDDISTRLPSQRDFNMWFKPIVPISLHNETLTIRVPSDYYYDRLEKDYIEALRTSLTKIFGADAKLEYQIVTDATHGLTTTGHSRGLSAHQTATAEATDAAKGRGAFRSNLDGRMRLDNFFISVCNRMVYNAAAAVIQKPGEGAFNPFFVHGASGVGKTHLLHAIGNEIVAHQPTKRVVYVPAQILKMQYVEASMRRRKPEDFIHFYQNVDVLLLDDIQELDEAVATQNAFFQIFNNLRMLGSQIVITADRAPSELKGLEERLYTRMKWGLTAELGRPDVALRKQILTSKLYESSITLPQEVFDFIVKHAEDNVRDIEGTLTSILAHSVFSNTPIDLDLAQRVMEQTVGVRERKMDVATILRTVGAYYNATPEEICGRSRKRPIVLARQITTYLAKEHTDASLSTIGKQVGGRDHTTVIYSVKAITNLMQSDLRIKKQVEEIRELLNL